MLLDHSEEMGINKRLSTKDCDKVDSHLLTLCQDPFDQIIGEFGLCTVSKGVAPLTTEIAVKRWGEDHDEGRPEAFFGFKLLPFLSPEKPCPVKQGFKEGSTVLRWHIVEDTPEKMLGRMLGILKKTAHSSNPSKNLLI
jgi:hypothetical protein